MVRVIDFVNERVFQFQSTGKHARSQNAKVLGAESETFPSAKKPGSLGTQNACSPCHSAPVTPGSDTRIT
jgi:hypothetical protein